MILIVILFLSFSHSTNPDARYTMARNLEILRTLDRYVWRIVRDCICSDTDFEKEVFAETVDLMRDLDQRPHSALPTKKLYKRKRLNLMRRFDAVKGHEFFKVRLLKVHT